MVNHILIVVALTLPVLLPPLAKTNDDPKPTDRAAIAAPSTVMAPMDSRRPMSDTQLIAALQSVLADLKKSPTPDMREVRAIEQLLGEARDRQFMAKR